MAELLTRWRISNESDRWAFWCPGCRETHAVEVVRWRRSGPDLAPSLSPSVHIPSLGCHLFVQDGQLVFLSDCTHHMAGKTVPMVPMADDEPIDVAEAEGGG